MLFTSLLKQDYRLDFEINKCNQKKFELVKIMIFRFLDFHVKYLASMDVK